MIASRKMAAAALMGFGFAAAGLSAASLNGARASDGLSAGSGIAEARIAAAFNAALGTAIDTRLQAFAEANRKGDLGIGLSCVGERWPEIRSVCLTSADGGLIRPARTVTIGQREGEATTILIRLPAPQVASR